MKANIQENRALRYLSLSFAGAVLTGFFVYIMIDSDPASLIGSLAAGFTIAMLIVFVDEFLLKR